MFEFADSMKTTRLPLKTLQCPRCSASVPPNPGMRELRSINYDEKDPGFCAMLGGFCKYARFDFMLYARPCCAVDPLRMRRKRKKAVTNINTLLDQADRVYQQLMGPPPTTRKPSVQSERSRPREPPQGKRHV
ncbi:unnamed protein product [Ranitomeya imitator]|uniref:E3 ubiquitin-protein ligase UBR4-like domain-containing protein n=1 Tax=Ranitomeya imitator TaxID=111125 RepID=A0ABN9M0D4_9NEOB|nr:unnamed protein product [Ranitomeya imitator]